MAQDHPAKSKHIGMKHLVLAIGGLWCGTGGCNPAAVDHNNKTATPPADCFGARVWLLPLDVIDRYAQYAQLKPSTTGLPAGAVAVSLQEAFSAVGTDNEDDLMHDALAAPTIYGKFASRAADPPKAWEIGQSHQGVVIVLKLPYVEYMAHELTHASLTPERVFSFVSEASDKALILSGSVGRNESPVGDGISELADNYVLIVLARHGPGRYKMDVQVRPRGSIADITRMKHPESPEVVDLPQCACEFLILEE